MSTYYVFVNPSQGQHVRQSTIEGPCSSPMSTREFQSDPQAYPSLWLLHFPLSQSICVVVLSTFDCGRDKHLSARSEEEECSGRPAIHSGVSVVMSLKCQDIRQSK